MSSLKQIIPKKKSSLSDKETQKLLSQKYIVDANDPEVQKLVSEDGMVKPWIGEEPEQSEPETVSFYPYYEEFIMRKKSYLVYEKVVDDINDQVWGGVEEYATYLCSKLIYQHHVHLDLALNESIYIEKSSDHAVGVLTASPWVYLDKWSLTAGFKKAIDCYIKNNLQHTISISFFKSDDLIREDLCEAAGVYSYYLFNNYLKKALLRDQLNGKAEPAPNVTITSHDSTTSPCESKAYSDTSVATADLHNLTDEPQPLKSKLSAKEVLILMYYLEQAKPFRTRISTVNQIQYQLLAVFTNFEPLSFATKGRRILFKKDNMRDKKYMENLLSKLTHENMGQSFKDELKKMIGMMENKWDTL